MINKSRVLALIPARAGSKGLPGKNIRPLMGKPLLAWPVEAARGSRYVDRVVVSTDSPIFAAIARKHGADIPILRPAELASDTAPSSAAVLHMLDHLEGAGECYDYLLLLEPTSPLTEPSDIDSALERLEGNRDIADALISVGEMVSSHPAFAVRCTKNGLIVPYEARNFSLLPRRQDVEPVFGLDGSLYLSNVAAYRRHQSFCHARTLAHVMPAYKSPEVDSLLDFLFIETILNNMDQLRETDHS